jgi:hypothetical protein
MLIKTVFIFAPMLTPSGDNPGKRWLIYDWILVKKLNINFNTQPDKKGQRS